MRRAGLLSAALVLLVCWYLYEPVPPGFSHPWKLRALSARTKFVLDVSWLAEKLGLVTVHDLVRSIDEFTADSTVQPRVKELIFDGVPVRAYNLVNAGESSTPGMVYYHGGGWALSSAKKYDRLMLSILDSLDSAVTIVSVEYRLAGKDGVRYPAPLHDCLLATKYFLTNARQFGVDPDRIAIVGDSAGGNLAAAIALKLRDDRFTPTPKLQVLIYPALQSVDFLLPSMVQHSHGPILKRYWIAWFWQLYATGSTSHVTQMLNNSHTSASAKIDLYNKYIRHENLQINYHYKPYKKPRLDYGDEFVWDSLKDVMVDPYFAPLLADNVSNLPEAYIYTPHDDVLRDDGILYSQRLQTAGVHVTHVEDPVGFHGVCSSLRWFPLEAGRCIEGITSFLKNKL